MLNQATLDDWSSITRSYGHVWVFILQVASDAHQADRLNFYSLGFAHQALSHTECHS